MQIQVGSIILKMLTGGPRWRYISTGAPVTPPPTGDLVPVWTAEYIDLSGVLRKDTINPDGSTVLNIRPYSNVTFDARDTRSSAAGCDTAAGAAQLINYGANYGEALGGTWSTSGLTNDIDVGPPIFHRCYTVGGLTRLAAVDTALNQVITEVTVNVGALGTVVDISSGGSWPTWTSNTTYGLASGNYTSRGDISMAGLYGIRIIKIGGGTDPIVAQFVPDSRGRATPTNITDRSRDIALVNIDYAKFAPGTVGVSYCGSYGGHCRHYGDGCLEPKGYYFDQAIHTADPISAGNCRHTRGVFIVNGGSIDSAGEEYCLITVGRAFNFSGTIFARTGGTTSGNPMRTYFDTTVLRHIQVYSTTACFHGLKGSAPPNVYAATPTDQWPDDDTFGSYTLSRASWVANGNGYEGSWGTGNSYFWVCNSVFGGPGSVVTTFLGGLGPQNNDVVTGGLTGPWANEDCYENPYISGYENNRLTFNTSNTLPLGGKDLSYRGNTQLDGSPWSVSTGYNYNRVHPSFQGPYHTQPREPITW